MSPPRFSVPERTMGYCFSQNCYITRHSSSSVYGATKIPVFRLNECKIALIMAISQSQGEWICGWVYLWWQLTTMRLPLKYTQHPGTQSLISAKHTHWVPIHHFSSVAVVFPPLLVWHWHWIRPFYDQFLCFGFPSPPPSHSPPRQQ